MAGPGGENIQLIDGETRVYDIAANGNQTLREIRDGNGALISGHGQTGKSMAQVEAARPRIIPEAAP